MSHKKISNCAIFGGFDLSQDQVQAGLAAMGRGNDGLSLATVGSVSLGHRRHLVLSDHKPGVMAGASDQPYWSDDAKVALIFNGEVYGYKDLRRSLSELGYRFVSQGDSETLLAGYLRWGEEIFSQKGIDMMFACAVVDLRRDLLLVARDWPGRVPLFYAQKGAKGSRFVFASQIKGLQSLPGVRQKDIQELEPGELLRVNLTSRKVVRARSFVAGKPSTSGTPEEVGSRLFEKLTAASRRRLMGDRLPCLFFSGGLDSLLTALATLRAAREQGIRDILQCYVFAVEGFDSEDVRRAWKAAQLIGHLGVQLHEVRVGAEEIVEAVPELIQSFEPMRPQAVSFYPLPIYYFLAPRMASDGFRAAIGGDGPDELLGAYDVWKEVALVHDDMKKLRARRMLINNMYEAILKRGSIMMMERGPVEMRFPFLETETAEFLLNVSPGLLSPTQQTCTAVRLQLGNAPNFKETHLGDSFHDYLDQWIAGHQPVMSDFAKLFWKLPLLMAGLEACRIFELPPDILISPKLRSQHGAGLTSLEKPILARYAGLGAHSDADLFQRIWHLLFEQRLTPEEIRRRCTECLG